MSASASESDFLYESDAEYAFPDALEEERRNRDSLAKMTPDELRVHLVVCRQEAIVRRCQIETAIAAHERELSRQREERRAREAAERYEQFARKFLCLIHIVDEKALCQFVRNWEWDLPTGETGERLAARRRDAEGLFVHNFTAIGTFNPRYPARSKTLSNPLETL